MLPFVFFSFVFVVVVVVLFCLFVFSKSFHFFQECSLWSQRTLLPPSPSDFALLHGWGLLKVQTITAYRFVFLLFSIDLKKIFYTIFIFDKHLRNLSVHLKLSYIYLQTFKVTRPSVFGGGGYHPTLKLSGIPTFTFIVKKTVTLSSISPNLSKH